MKELTDKGWIDSKGDREQELDRRWLIKSNKKMK